jgi:hypothetical protein
MVMDPTGTRGDQCGTRATHYTAEAVRLTMVYVPLCAHHAEILQQG